MEADYELYEDDVRIRDYWQCYEKEKGERGIETGEQGRVDSSLLKYVYKGPAEETHGFRAVAARPPQSLARDALGCF